MLTRVSENGEAARGLEPGLGASHPSPPPKATAAGWCRPWPRLADLPREVRPPNKSAVHPEPQPSRNHQVRRTPHLG